MCSIHAAVAAPPTTRSLSYSVSMGLIVMYVLSAHWVDDCFVLPHIYIHLIIILFPSCLYQLGQSSWRTNNMLFVSTFFFLSQYDCTSNICYSFECGEMKSTILRTHFLVIRTQLDGQTIDLANYHLCYCCRLFVFFINWRGIGSSSSVDLD